MNLFRVAAAIFVVPFVLDVRDVAERRDRNCAFKIQLSLAPLRE